MDYKVVECTDQSVDRFQHMQEFLFYLCARSDLSEEVMLIVMPLSMPRLRSVG